MPVTRKPHPKAETNETAIRAFIDRGGNVPTETVEGRAKLVQLRLPPELIARIDIVLKARPVPPSRHHWILEAIHEKLQREQG